VDQGHRRPRNVTLLRSEGIDADQLLSTAELSRAQLTENPSDVSAVSQHRFLELAAAETDDPLLGLHVAAEMDLREIGLLFYLAASSATVGEALEQLAEYAATTTEEIRLEILPKEDEAVLYFHRVLTVDQPVCQQSELATLGIIRALRKMTNSDFSPSRISFAHARSSGLREIHRVLRCPVEFVQAVDCWVLPHRIMELPIVSEDSHLQQILEAHADEIMSEKHTVAGLRRLVEDRLIVLLPSGRTQAAVIAEQLGMSERSFRRRLVEEGANFGEIVDRLRHRLALRYLEDERVSLKQIAWLLGYSELGAFNHAFKRWTRTSPGAMRKQSAS